MRQVMRKFIWGIGTVFVLGLSVPSISHATSNTQNEIDATKENMDELEAIISAHEKELEGMKGEQSALQKRLSELNVELATVSEHLTNLEQQIVEKEADIAVTQQNLADAKALESWQYECMEKRIRYTYERRSESWFTKLLGAGGFAKLLNMSTYVESIVSYDDRMLEELIANREFIESEEARLEKEKLELDILKINAQAEKSKVNELISDVSESIADYADQIADAEAAALEYEKELKKLEENLDYLKKKLAQEIALSQAAANATWRDISQVSFAEGDRYLLANLIYCEAGGEPYEGQVAVGAVVMNRVMSSKFPDTVVGVIYQKRQFSPVASGRLELALAANKATPSCYKAADEAMAGVTNVGNCLFFRTPIEGLTGISIGGHIFY